MADFEFRPVTSSGNTSALTTILCKETSRAEIWLRADFCNNVPYEISIKEKKQICFVSAYTLQKFDLKYQL